MRVPRFLLIVLLIAFALIMPRFSRGAVAQGEMTSIAEFMQTPTGITEALEWGPDGLTGVYTHGEESWIYTFDPTTCSLTNTVLYAVPYNDVESLVFP